MKKTSTILWGIALVALGVCLGLNALGVANINLFFPGWWTLFIIIPSLVGLFGRGGSRSGSAIGLAIGLFLLLAAQGVIGFGTLWKLIFPTIIIIVGLSLLFGDKVSGKVREEVKNLRGTVTDEECCVTFGEQKVNFGGKKFRGCKLEAIFGTMKCDLRDAIVEKDALVSANAIFGSVIIRVPKDVNVQVISGSMFGGVSDRHEDRPKDIKKKTLYIDATCLFGGVEIR